MNVDFNDIFGKSSNNVTPQTHGKTSTSPSSGTTFEDDIIVPGKYVEVFEDVYKINSDGSEQQIFRRDYANPDKFIYDYGIGFPAFEKALAGKREGDTFEVMLLPEENKHLRNKDSVIEIDINIVSEQTGKHKSDLRAGEYVYLTGSDGNKYFGVIKRVNDINAFVDFNPFVDIKCKIIGTVNVVRNPTVEELREYKEDAISQNKSNNRKARHVSDIINDNNDSVSSSGNNMAGIVVTIVVCVLAFFLMKWLWGFLNYLVGVLAYLIWPLALIGVINIIINVYKGTTGQKK